MGQDFGVRRAFESGLIYVVLYDCVEELGSGSGTPGQPTRMDHSPCRPISTCTNFVILIELSHLPTARLAHR